MTARSRLPPEASVSARPRPRASRSTKKQTIDHTGRSSTGFMIGERRSFGYSSRGPSETHATGTPSS